MVTMLSRHWHWQPEHWQPDGPGPVTVHASGSESAEGPNAMTLTTDTSACERLISLMSDSGLQTEFQTRSSSFEWSLSATACAQALNLKLWCSAEMDRLTYSELQAPALPRTRMVRRWDKNRRHQSS
jgi:hypothetical protein